MNYIDITLLGIILLISYKGFFDGFVHEISALIGIVVGIFFASRLASDMAVFFNTHIYAIQSASISITLGFLIVLAFFWLGFLVIGFVVSKFVKYSGLRLFDMILGYLFSCLKVFCIFAFIFYGLQQIKFIHEIDFVKNLPQRSNVYYAMIETAKIIVKFDDPQKITQQLERLNSKIPKALQDATEQIKEKIPTPYQK